MSEVVAQKSEVETQETAGLVRQLGLFDSTILVVGVVIGAGIFITTGMMAKVLPSPALSCLPG